MLIDWLAGWMGGWLGTQTAGRGDRMIRAAAAVVCCESGSWPQTTSAKQIVLVRTVVWRIPAAAVDLRVRKQRRSKRHGCEPPVSGRTDRPARAIIIQ